MACSAKEVDGEHLGQPHPWNRLATVVCHSWPLSHNHQTFFLEPAVTWKGAKYPFLVGCHWRARSWSAEAKSLKPIRTRLPAQKGQPTPFVRFATVACHAWPSSQRHQARLPECMVTPSGNKPRFLSGCHCAAKPGD